jgi:integrase
MATIRKRVNETTIKYQARVRVSNHPTITKTFNLRSHAIQWARETEIQIEKGDLNSGYKPTKETLADALERYLKEITPRKKSSDREESRINNLIKDPIALVQFCNLRPQHIIAYRNHRLNKVTSGTVLRELAVLSHVIKIGIEEWGLPLDKNPVQQITKPKQNPPRDRRLERDEEDLLLQGCSVALNPYFKGLVIVAIETAMRRGELLSLERCHLNLKNRTAYLPTTKNGSPRTVPLSTRAMATLNKIPTHISGKVFPISETALRGQWRRTIKKAGIKNLRLHDLRHEATSRFFEKGLNIMEVSTITGHKDLKMLKRYTHLKAEDLALKLG